MGYSENEISFARHSGCADEAQGVEEVEKATIINPLWIEAYHRGPRVFSGADGSIQRRDLDA